MWSPERDPVLGAVVPWYEAIDHPGAFQMGRLRALFESRPWHRLVPDPSFVLDGPSHGGAKVRAAVADDDSFAFVYSPRGEPFTVDKGRISGSRIEAIWYDPRYGVAHPIHTANTGGIQTYTPPTSGRGHDWILILEDAGRNFPLPDKK
jgi:hypothetical protein